MKINKFKTKNITIINLTNNLNSYSEYHQLYEKCLSLKNINEDMCSVYMCTELKARAK